MLIPMAKVRVIGHKGELDRALALLHRLRLIHVVAVSDDSGATVPPLAIDQEHLRELEDLRYLRTRVDGLLTLGTQRLHPRTERVELTAADVERLRAELDEEAPQLEALVRRLDELRLEQETLPRYAASLQRLLPLVPELTELEAYATTAMLVDSRHAHVLGELNAALTDLVGANYEIISDQVDATTVGAVLVYPRSHAVEIESLLGRGQLSRVRLPHQFQRMPFRTAVTEMLRRLALLPSEIQSVSEAIDDALARHRDWADASRYLAARIEQLSVIRLLGATPHTFVASGWVPERDVETLISAVREELGPTVVVEVVRPQPTETPPVLMENVPPARPFEMLVRLLALPRYGARDPTALMAVFLPLFFGIMLGDVAYGAALALLAWLVHRRFGLRSPAIRDLSRILMVAAAWSIVWGVIYGEFLGDLGHRLWAWEPLWINREEALEPLLVFAMAIGAAHVALGLVLGIIDAARAGHRRVLIERLATIVALVGLFAIAGVAAGQAPSGLITPGIAGVVVGLVVLMAAGGAIGVLMAPLELLGTVGNVLSYLRIAAIGLASVYLARVANELGATGPLWIGVMVATLFHALNLALGAFSPTIQSLRLHYVEFFGKFFDEGGEAFHPFGTTNNDEMRPRAA